jgi:hypothetical protein
MSVPAGDLALHGRVLRGELSERWEPGRDARRVRQDLRLSERLGGLRRWLLQAELPNKRHVRRQRRMRRHVSLRGRGHVHERHVSPEGLHPGVRLRPDLQQRPVHHRGVRRGRNSMRLHLLQLG